MSARHVGWALDEVEDLSPTPKLVLVYLCDRLNDDRLNWGSWPSAARIAQKVNVSKRTVQRALRDLEAADLIRPQQLVPGRSPHYLIQGPDGWGGDKLSPPDVEVVRASRKPSWGDTGVAQNGRGGDTGVAGGGDTGVTRKHKDEPSSPPGTLTGALPPRGARTSPAILKANWGRFCDIVQDRPHAVASRVRTWGPTQVRQVRKLDQCLGGDWSVLFERAETLAAKGASGRADFSLPRLTSHDCTRAQEVLEGVWSESAPAESNGTPLEWR